MSRSLLCETVTGGTMADLLAARDAAEDTDLVELRLDGVDHLDVARALHGRRRPAIVTCRPVWEGGRFEGSEEARRRILSEALLCGAEYVDVEWRSLQGVAAPAGFDSLLQTGGRRVVVSSHDFSGMPDDLDGQVRAMRATGAAVIKIAVTPTRLSDLLLLRDVAEPGDAVVVAMGHVGLATRLLATRFRSRWTYAGKAAAPGQIPATRMLRAFRFRETGDRTLIYGVVGDEDVMRSPLPAMHNAAFDAAGFDAVCVPLVAADFQDFLTFARALDVSGASVARRFAEEALARSARADDATRRAGTADLIRRTPAGWEALSFGDLVEDFPTIGSQRMKDLGPLMIRADQQFAWWTGTSPDGGAMRTAVKREAAYQGAVGVD